MKQKFRFTAEPRSALCLLSMALMLLSAAARLWYYLADPVATAMTLSQADIFLLVGLPVFSAALYPAAGPVRPEDHRAADCARGRVRRVFPL